MRHRIVSILVWLGTSWTCFQVLKEHGYEGRWMPLQDIMKFSFPAPFSHRALFVVLADAIQAAFPSFGYLKCFLLSQLVAILAAFEAIRRWAALFVRAEFAFLAQLLLAVILIPTLRYYNFYDFGIVFFFSASLLCLFQERFFLYLGLLALGTLNHEIVLLLVPVYLALQLPQGIKRLETWGRVALQLSVWGGVRLVMFWLLPSGMAPRILIATNLQEILHPTAGLLTRYLGPALWMGVAVLGYRHAPPALRRTVILLPMLVATTFVFGQFHEVRQFDAFVPVLVALILCALPAKFAASAHRETL
jgi:hypothetical protein